LTGATGLVGSAALVRVLALPEGLRPKLSILSRRSVPIAEGKPGVDVIIHKDFTTYPPEVLEKLKGAEGCIWAQGISVTQVDKDEYKKITIDYPIAAAKAFSSLSDKFKFVYISGEGATTTPGMLTPHFGKIKGQAELDLLELAKATSSLKPFSVRPGMVDPINDPEVLAAIAGKGESILTKVTKSVLSPPFRKFWPSGTSPTEELGKFMVALALSDGSPLKGDDLEGGGRILPNRAVRRLAKEGVFDKE